MQNIHKQFNIKNVFETELLTITHLKTMHKIKLNVLFTKQHVIATKFYFDNCVASPLLIFRAK